MELSRSGLDTSIVGPGLVPELGSCEPKLTANDFLPVSLVANLTAVPLGIQPSQRPLASGPALSGDCRNVGSLGGLCGRLRGRVRIR
jgi:hypothetical protein